MSAALNAQVVINVSLDTKNSKVAYNVTTNEGDCNGLNQLAERVKEAVQESLPIAIKGVDQ